MLHTRYAPVRHSCTPEEALPFDLHVLGLPLAFILSQDQTLHCNICFLRLATVSPARAGCDLDSKALLIGTRVSVDSILVSSSQRTDRISAEADQLSFCHSNCPKTLSNAVSFETDCKVTNFFHSANFFFKAAKIFLRPCAVAQLRMQR
jgi:hypothetical protein